MQWYRNLQEVYWHKIWLTFLNNTHLISLPKYPMKTLYGFVIHGWERYVKKTQQMYFAKSKALILQLKLWTSGGPKAELSPSSVEVTSKRGFFQSWDAALVQANNNDSSERPFGLRGGAISCQICGLTTILGSAKMRHKLPWVIRFLLGKMFREWLAARQEPLLNGQWTGRGGAGGGGKMQLSIGFIPSLNITGETVAIRSLTGASFPSPLELCRN